ncbi:activator encoded in prophage CP-933I [Escherichia coli]|nr:activator encoded in prophage CP-933I [Escherichia coli]
MALKCPECGTTAHARTSAYEAPSVKRSWYQCQILNVPTHLPHWKVWIR